MNTITLRALPARFYTNNGQHAEQVARYTLTGRIERADNKPFTAGGDCGSLQIKSARATVCKGTDLEAHLDRDGATAWGYVTADFSRLYIMSRAEYTEFCKAFGTVTRESTGNGGATKIRLKSEGKEMRAWLEKRA